MTVSDINIDQQDLLLASGAFDDGFSDPEYERFLQSLVDERAEEEYLELRFRELQVREDEF
jgi:hypothetical protein